MTGFLTAALYDWAETNVLDNVLSVDSTDRGRTSSHGRFDTKQGLWDGADWWLSK